MQYARFEIYKYYPAVHIFHSWFQLDHDHCISAYHRGKKKNLATARQDLLLFRFKNFAPSGQLVKLSSSQTVSQGCVPSLSLLPRGADYRAPHDGVRTWSRPCLQALTGLPGMSHPFVLHAGLVLLTGWVEICCSSPSQSSAVGLTQFTLWPLQPDPGSPCPALTAPPQRSKDCWDFSNAMYKLWETGGRDISSGLFLLKWAPGQGPVHRGFLPEFQVGLQSTHALSLQILLEWGTSSLLQTSATSILQPRKALPPAGSLSVQYTPCLLRTAPRNPQIVFC